MIVTHQTSEVSKTSEVFYIQPRNMRMTTCPISITGMGMSENLEIKCLTIKANQ
jgi:hypothetical protein